MDRTIAWCRLVLIGGLMAVAGCGQTPGDAESLIQAENADNIHRLTNLYSAFTDQNRGVGPKDEKQFRDFIPKLGPERLKRMGIEATALDALFVSERDSKPFEIRYRQKRPDSRSQRQGAGGGAAEVPVILEEVGVKGVRQVGFLGTRVVKSLESSQIARSE